MPAEIRELEPLALQAERLRVVADRGAAVAAELATRAAAERAAAAARGRRAAAPGSTELGYTELAFREAREAEAAAERARREAELALVRARGEAARGGGGGRGGGAAAGRAGEREREARPPARELALHQELDRALTDLRTELNATLRPDLSELASGFLRDLTNGRYTDLELDEDYGATLLDDGDPKAVISGGEEDVANLALRLAISQMIAERAGQPLSLLILDEIFGSLDEERRAAVVDLLRSLADRFPQVILITHIDSVREGFDRVIRVGFDRGPRRRDGAGRAASEGTMWRPDRSVRGPDRPTLARHRPAQPGLRRGVHRPLQPRRPRRASGCRTSTPWSGATRSRTPATAP